MQIQDSGPRNDEAAADGLVPPSEGFRMRAVTESDRIKKSERWLIALTALAGIAGLISAAIFWSQLSVMKGQLSEMQSSAKQVDRSIEATNRLARATEKQAELFRQIARAANHSAELGLKANSIAASQLSTARDAEQKEERAYITIEVGTEPPVPSIYQMDDEDTVAVNAISGGPDPNVGGALGVHAKNVGKTSAILKDFWADVILSESDPDKGQSLATDETDARTMSSMTGRSVISQGSQTAFTVQIRKLTGLEKTDLLKGKEHLFITGAAFYSDVFGVNHKTSFCYVSSLRRAILGVFYPCRKYNEAT